MQPYHQTSLEILGLLEIKPEKEKLNLMQPYHQTSLEILGLLEIKPEKEKLNLMQPYHQTSLEILGLREKRLEKENWVEIDAVIPLSILRNSRFGYNCGRMLFEFKEVV